jgi:hypothetical protein
MQSICLRRTALLVTYRLFNPTCIYLKSFAFEDTNNPMMRPKSPRTELKISITRILTNLETQLAMEFDQNITYNVQTWIRSIRQSSTASINAHRYATHQIAHSHCQASPEQRIPSIVIASRVECISFHYTKFGREYNGHDDAVDGYNFAENDGDQVLRANAGSFDTSTEN